MIKLRKQIFSTCAVSALLAGALLAFFTMETVGPVQAAEEVKVAGIKKTPGGQTYGRWAAEWWQWAVGTPAATSPFFDDGANCANRQVSDTWFLAGSFGPDPVVRNCTVPAGKALFFPLINNAYFGFLNDPPEKRTEDFVRNAASCTEPAELSVTIDGEEFRNGKLQKFTTRGQSPFYNVQLPPGNLFGDDGTGIPGLVLSPSAEEGWYLYVEPLAPGAHTIHWFATGCTAGNVQDITYHLTIGASS